MTDIDITDRIGPLYSPKEEAEWPMYSYDRPAYTLWNAIAVQLHKQGWSEDEIKTWLQSKVTRWSLDGELGEQLIRLGTNFAKTISKKELDPYGEG